MKTLLRKNCLIVFVILLLSPIFLCVATVVYGFANSIGRVGDFRPVSDGFEIPNTNYAVRVSRITSGDKKSALDEVFELALEDKEAQTRFEIGRWSMCGHWCLPDYTFLQSHDSTYFIIKYPGHQATHFRIYNISVSPPKELSTNHPDRNEPFSNVYASCLSPRLEDNKLIFEYVSDCELYPLFEQPIFYDLELQ